MTESEEMTLAETLVLQLEQARSETSPEVISICIGIVNKIFEVFSSASEELKEFFSDLFEETMEIQSRVLRVLQEVEMADRNIRSNRIRHQNADRGHKHRWTPPRQPSLRAIRDAQRRPRNTQ